MNLEFDQATHTYKLDGVKVPSVTQILNELVQCSLQVLHIPEYVSPSLCQPNNGGAPQQTESMVNSSNDLLRMPTLFSRAHILIQHHNQLQALYTMDNIFRYL